MIFVLYSILYRFRLVPRALSVFGLVTVMLKITALTMPFFGHRIVLAMVLPQPVIYLALALLLVAKGLKEWPRPFDAEAQQDASGTLRGPQVSPKER
ncbi:MAG: hypothetical protein EYC70_13750 [Planctomycetota bacterium]|nr:MAG: hypothetical protein EYC70_13750 [Planctomycetota bacterium]